VVLYQGCPGRPRIGLLTSVRADRAWKVCADVRCPCRVHLLGQLSSPSSSLKRVLEAALGTPVRPPAISVLEPRRLGNGVVQRAVVEVLAAAGRPMRLSEIRSAVDDLLGQPVSVESVSWSLRLGCRGEQPRFERIKHGIYRLRDQT
jgi:hypothetical protein